MNWTESNDERRAVKGRHVAPLIAVGLGGLLGLAEPASAAGKLQAPQVEKGSYFSKAYGVSVEDNSTGYELATHWVTKGGKRVDWKNKRWFSDKLTPGKYTLHRKVVPVKDDLPGQTTWAQVEDWDGGRSGSVSATYAPVGITGSGEYWDGTQTGQRFHQVFSNSNGADCYYFGDGYQQIYVPCGEVTKPAWFDDWDGLSEGLVWRSDGDYVYVERADHYTATVTVTVKHRRSGAVYTGTFTDNDVYEGEYDQALNWVENYIPSGTSFTRVVEPTWPRVQRDSRGFTVRAVNGKDVTTREAKAIKIGMPMSQVHRIFGTAGRNGLKASGFSVRHYDGSVTIGYSNGRVQSIQRY